MSHLRFPLKCLNTIIFQKQEEKTVKKIFFFTAYMKAIKQYMNSAIYKAISYMAIVAVTPKRLFSEIFRNLKHF